MNVTFSDKEEFLEELRHAPDGTVVRGTIEREEINDGGESVRVVVGFVDQEFLFEATLECGEHWKGGPDHAGETAQQLLSEIKAASESCGCKFRGGKWQQP